MVKKDGEKIGSSYSLLNCELTYLAEHFLALTCVCAKCRGMSTIRSCK